MKSAKKVLKKRSSRYYLRSRKSVPPTASNGTPKLNREVQASLSKEENCTLLFELPFQTLIPVQILNRFLPVTHYQFPPHFPVRAKQIKRIQRPQISASLQTQVLPLSSHPLNRPLFSQICSNRFRERPLNALKVEEIRDFENLGSQEDEESSARGSPVQLINQSVDLYEQNRRKYTKPTDSLCGFCGRVALSPLNYIFALPSMSLRDFFFSPKVLLALYKRSRNIYIRAYI